MTELRMHGRGGQGTVMAAEILTAAMVAEGTSASCFPFFGQERRGAPVQAFVRYGEEKVRLRSKIYTPNIVMVFDATLAANSSWYQGLLPGGAVVANGSIDEIAKKVPAETEMIAVIDGNKIALDVMGRAITNTAMLGCFAGATGVVKLETLLDTLGDYFTGKTLSLNRDCIQRGYKEVQTFFIQPDRTFRLK